jgi:hypothetical protein
VVERMWRVLGGRKFLGLVVATVLCAAGRINGAEWVAAFGLYAVTNVAADKVAKGGTASG